MKRFFLFLFLALVALSTVAMGGLQKVAKYNRITKKTYYYPLITVRQLEQVSLDSLLRADAIQTTTSTDTAHLQWSPYYHGGPDGDTVVVRGLVVVPPKVINFTAEGYTLLIYDTINAYPWGGVFVRVDNEPDADLEGFNSINAGDIIEMTLVVREYPDYSGSPTLNGQTEPAPVPGFPFIPVGHKTLPAPLHKQVSDFYTGQFQGGGAVNFSGGEPFENMICEFTNLDYNGELSTGTGRYVFRLVDSLGNELTTYDCSRWFTTRTDLNGNLTPPQPFRDPASTWVLPPIGSHIDTIRGYMVTASGAQNGRGYRIASVYPGDVVVGNVKATLNTHRRNPVVPLATDTVQITAKVNIGTFPVDSTQYPKLYYSVNYGAYSPLLMTKAFAGDTVYHAKLPPQPAGTLVSYYMQVQDTTGLFTRLANAHPSQGSDTSKGKFFYEVSSTPITTIHDIQFTPYVNGYSPYIGGILLTTGTLTADTVGMMKTMRNPPPSGGFGTYTWYIQAGSQPWSGLWIQAPESLMHGYVNGDSIVVRGTIGEGSANAITTQMYNIDSVALIAHGRPVPAPTLKTTGTFGPSATNGTATAEPYEGMLVEFANVHVSSLAPYYSDPTEYGIDDGTGEVRVRRDGTNNYSNQIADTALGYQILNLGDKIDTLIGVMYYSANAWKICPRGNSDFRSSKYYSVNNRWNMVSVPQRVGDYHRTAVYPMVSQPLYTYNHGYVQEDSLVNGIGYWAKFPAAQALRYNGLKISVDTIPVKQGWNMIGSITDSVAVGAIVPIGCTVQGSVYQYTTGYTPTTYIRGGSGYWAKVSADGQLVLNGPSFFSKQGEQIAQSIQALQQLNSVTITDRNGNSQLLYFGPVNDGKLDVNNFEMPPQAPAGSFDARFTSQRMAELYPNQLKSPVSYSIKLTSASYPVTVSWSITDKDPNRSFQISGASGDKNAKQTVMVGNGAATIKSAKGDELVLIVNNSALPKQFALGQNYPNPFNPTTRMTIAVPQNARVEVNVYDILGRKVKTLMSEDKAPGYYTVEWNGLSEASTSVSSGVYFIRMTSDRFSAVRKVMMMK